MKVYKTNIKYLNFILLRIFSPKVVKNVEMIK